MSQIRLPGLGRALFILACLCESGTAVAQETIPLVFNWPDTLNGTATITFERDRVDGATRYELSGEGRTRFTVSPVADTLLLTFDDTEIDLHIEGDQGIQARVDAVFTEVTRKFPDYMVGRNGEFLGLSDPAGFRKTVDAAVAELTADLPPDVMRRLRPTLDLSLSEASLISQAELSWNSQVGNWIGMVLEPGMPLHGEGTHPSPMMVDTVMQARLTYTLVGQAPCAAPNGCVALESRSVIDSPEASEAYAALLRGADQDGNTEIRIETYRVEWTSRVISDPDTLLPYRSTTRQTVTIEMAIGDVPLATRDFDVQTVVYEYSR